MPPPERAEFGCVVTIAEQKTGERETHLIQGVAPREGLRRLAEELDARDGDWRVTCISTPNTIYGDLCGRTQGNRPEAIMMGQLGRLDLLTARPDHAESDGRRRTFRGGT